MALLQISDGGESPTFKPVHTTSKLVIIEGVSHLKICGLIHMLLMATVSPEFTGLNASDSLTLIG